MEDLAGKLNEILNNPAEMEKFQQMANSLLGQMNTEQQNNMPEQSKQQPISQQQQQQNQNNNTGGLDLNMLSSLLAQQAAPEQTQPTNNNAAGALSSLGGLGQLGSALGALGGGGNGGISPDMISTIMKIAPLLSSLNQEDDSTRLLNALRPLLKNHRQKKIDEAIKIMRMLKFLPILKQQGILQGIL